MLKNRKPKKSVQVMIAGGICGRGKTPLIILPPKTNIGADNYIDMILPTYLNFMKDNEMFPNPNQITFMQDGAPGHYANKTLQVSFVMPGSCPLLLTFEIK